MSENTNTTEKGYQLKALTIFSTNGKYFDVYPQMIELNLFEDIYNSTMSGSLLLSDSIDLFADIPLSGFEFIKIIMNKKGYDKDVIMDKTFRIYKMQFDEVSNKPTQAGQTYILYFCSEENILSLSRSISKSYRGKTSSDIVKDILMHQLGVSSEKLLIENIEETYGRHNLIIPYMNPLSAISWIATRTLSNSGKGVSPSFLFYENRFGYHFKSIEKLFKNDTAIKYTYTPKNVEKTETIEQEYHDVIKYEFMNVFDIIKSTTSGMFSGVLKGIDLVRLRADDTVLDYEENFNNTVHVENDLITKIEDRKTPYPFYNKNEDRLKNSTTKNYFAFRRMYPTNSGHDTLSSIRSKQPSIIPNLVEKWMLQRSSRLSQLNYFKLKLLAPGDTLVTTGDIIEFRVPLMARKVKGELNENPYYSGRYMVTAIRHIMNTSKYEMIIEATRDCLSTAYKDADNTNPDVIEIKRQ